MQENPSRRDKLHALYRAAQYDPKLTVGVIVLSVFAALFEGIGLSFILPIVELAQGATDPEQAGGVLGLFANVYAQLGVPFTLGYLVAGVFTIMTIRYTSSFFVGWFRGTIQTHYKIYLQELAFERALNARTAYFDQEGSDEIMNAIVTQAQYAANAIRRVVRLVEQGLLSIMYFSIAVYFAPVLTLLVGVSLGVITFVFDRVLESGYSIGDRIAEANEQIQTYAQAGTKGIRDVKMYDVRDEMLNDFRAATKQFDENRVQQLRNQTAINKFYQLFIASVIFSLIYVSLEYTSMGLGTLSVFLFALFRLGPRVSNLNDLLYQIDADLAHLVRTQTFVDDLADEREPPEKQREIPDHVETIEFDSVSFSYDSETDVLRDVSFSVDQGEFVAFVGPSGAGKSTIVSLLARLYEPTSGTITANATPINQFDINKWRSKIALVRQDPYIFNDTLQRNLTVGNRSASDENIERACQIAQITEFLDDLPDGLQTVLGDDGVRLSGGQRQRVALARALVKDADLLVLDEATSDLDTEIESDIQRALATAETDYSIITVAHRLSTVRNADRIYTVEEGRIVETGAHQNLINKNGKYADLYSKRKPIPGDDS